ncbi:XRE family transcriptional regulator [Paralcaligenes sp. KSB-10]|uniref:helix-turn-helix domain-containing protein n=1 Tax=Paralcaligenes sp. KSB-10 TaxID=2901142 RepID=UPI001E3F67C5|nr:XRE family transcriptional regulator [Paralcaligenes sp. KSB-10]UHL62618.1 XRE family transcriptional regulator [Paralcaligenes sp. KSB-10]
MTDLPHRLKTLRRQQSFSLEQLARNTGLTKSYLSKLERGISEPSISTVLRLADAYQISVGQLLGTGEAAQDEIVSVVRVAEREPLLRRGEGSSYRYQSMAGRRKIKAMEPFIIYPPRVFPDLTSVFPHPGEEFMLVLKGAVEVNVGEREYRLDCGDSVYFDAEFPHRIRTVGRVMAEVLVITTHATAKAQ